MAPLGIIKVVVWVATIESSRRMFFDHAFDLAVNSRGLRRRSVVRRGAAPCLSLLVAREVGVFVKAPLGCTH